MNLGSDQLRQELKDHGRPGFPKYAQDHLCYDR